MKVEQQKLKKLMSRYFGLLIIGASVILLSSFLPYQESELSKSMTRGKEVYAELCITCHLADGNGMEGAFPPLAKSDYLLKSPDKAIHAIKFGQEGEITVNGETYNNIMPAPGLSDQEVADVMNYILNSWGNKGKLVTLKAVEAVKE